MGQEAPVPRLLSPDIAILQPHREARGLQQSRTVLTELKGTRRSAGCAGKVEDRQVSTKFSSHSTTLLMRDLKPSQDCKTQLTTTWQGAGPDHGSCVVRLDY